MIISDYKPKEFVFIDFLLQGKWKHAYAYDYVSFERFKAQYEYSCSFVSAMDPVFNRDKFLNKTFFASAERFKVERSR